MIIESNARSLFGKHLPLSLYAISVLASFQPSAGHADYYTQTVNGPGQGTTAGTGWQVSAAVPAFNLPYTTLTGIAWSLYGGAIVDRVYTNPGSTPSYQSVSGSATIKVMQGNTVLGTVNPRPYYYTAVGPHITTDLMASDGRSATGSFSNLNDVGLLKLVCDSGSGPNLQTLGSVNVIYTYTKMGTTAQDAIQPATSNNGVYTFPNLPSGRWYGVPIANAYRFDLTSSNSFFNAISNFASGFAGTFHVTANGVDYGTFSGGQSLTFAAGVSSFMVDQIQASGANTNALASTAEFAFQPTFNRDGVTMVATSLIPEPATWMLVVASGGAILLVCKARTYFYPRASC